MALQSLAKAKADVVAATAKLNEFVAPTLEEVVRLEEAKNEAVAANLALKGSNIILQQSRVHWQASQWPGFSSEQATASAGL